MGITSKDVAAQRAMLARGEEKRLRDQFAAAVLPICNRNNRTDEQIAENAYRLADAMLHERAKRQAIAATEKAMRDAEDFVAIRGQFLAWSKEQSVGVAEMDSVADRKSVATPRACASSCSQPFDSAPTTHDTPPQSRAGKNVAKTVQEVSKCTERENEHDAAPDARARDADRVRTDKATTRPGNGTGNTPSEAEIDALEYVVEEGRTASVDDYGVLRSWLIRLRPEWESQSYEESDEKLTNTNTNRDTTPSVGSVQDKIMTIKPLAYAAVAADGSESVYVASLKEQAEACCRENGWFLLPLYAAPSTWQEEVDAVEAAFERSGVKPIWPTDEAGNIGPMAEAMADEIERLRTPATQATAGRGSVQDGCTLTDAEREAVEAADAYMSAAGCHNTNVQKTLRGLLERLGGER